MTRTARAVADGFPHHIVQRGNNKGNVFFNLEDKYRYLMLLKKYSQKWQSSILAYCLMDNHVHLLVMPSVNGSLSKMMQGIALSHSKYINGKYQRTGRLWESRFYSSIVDTEGYLWTVARYIEQNPIRAKVVKQSPDYPFSSAAAHVRGESDPVLNGSLLDESEKKEYAAFLDRQMEEEELQKIRHATRSETPFGGLQFVRKVEEQLRRKF